MSTDAQMLAEQAQEALDQAAEIKRSRKSKVWMPNAIGVNPKPFLEARARMHKNQTDVFAHAEKLIKDPKPGWRYAWARLNAPTTVMRAGSGLYKYIQPSEVKSELAQMFATHKGTTGTMVCHGSLVLVGISPQAWTELYIEPEIESVARLASQEDYFQAQIEEASQGTAQGTVERVQERDTLSE